MLYKVNYDSDSDHDLPSHQGVHWTRRRRRMFARHMQQSLKRMRVQTKKRNWTRLDWAKWTDADDGFLTDDEFVRFYKLDKHNFAERLKKMIPHMKKARPNNRTDKPIQYELEFAVTLRWLAGGNYLDIMYHHGISESGFWRAIHACIYAILIEYADDELGSSKFSDSAKLDEIERTFAQHNQGAVRGCVGAVDGMAVKIKRPTLSECDNPMSYYSRKGFYAVVLQAICDGDCKFLWGSILAGGSTHDSTCWSITELSRYVYTFTLDYHMYIYPLFHIHN
jgi:hypothetical protein